MAVKLGTAEKLEKNVDVLIATKTFRNHETGNGFQICVGR